MDKTNVIIGGIGATSELSRSLIIELAAKNYRVFAITRNQESLNQLKAEWLSEKDVFFYNLDMNQKEDVERFVENIESDFGPIEAYIHNAGKLFHAPFLKTCPKDFEESWRTNMATAINFSQSLIERMQRRKSGKLIFAGATASIKGSSHFSAFASAKFALRGFAQSLAREFASDGIQVCHFIVDGVIWGQRAEASFQMKKEDCISEADLAKAYIGVLAQKRGGWFNEVEIRPYREKF